MAEDEKEHLSFTSGNSVNSADLKQECERNWDNRASIFGLPGNQGSDEEQKNNARW